jgi:hypothetical protein
MAITRAQQARQMLKQGSEPVEQAGVMNYMPSEMVTVPKIAKSSPDTPTAKLAYITPEEEDILVDLNLYGSLKGKPNKGPGGIPSLEGDFGPGGKGNYSEAGTGRGVGKSTDKDVSAFTDTGTGKYSVSDRPQDRKAVSDYIQGKMQFQGGKKPGFFTGPGTLKQRQQVFNLQQRQNLIDRLIAQNRKKLQAGLMDPSIPGVDTMTTQEMIDIAPSIASMTDLYSQETIDDVLAGNRQIDFFTPTGSPTLDMIGNIFSGPVTSEKLSSLSKTISDLQNIDVRDTTTKDIMKEFAPNQYEMVYGEKKGEGDGRQNILPVPQAPTVEATEDDYYPGGNPFENRTAYRFMNKGGIADTVVGGEYDFESARQMYGLGKLVKKVTKTVKKIAKSDIGKAALLYAGTAGLGYLGAGATKAGSGSMFGFLKPGNVLTNLMTSGRNLGLLKSKFPGFSERVGPLSKLGNFLGSPMGGILTASALAGLMTPKPEDEDEDEDTYRGEKLDIAGIRRDPYAFMPRRFAAEGGDIEKEPVAKKTMPLLDMGGKEMDLREEGGFVPIGRMEKADDVPARLSKNEFVFTADAVRNAGDGDVDKGAEVMYNMMKNLESGGDVSEESQGLEGARKMFKTSQRLEEVL